MKSSAIFLLPLGLLSLGQGGESSTCDVPGSSGRCNGIQGTGKDADICCAEECVCTCGGTSEANAGKECFISAIRADPPALCTGNEDASAACALGPEDMVGEPCELVDGVLDDDGMLCCPAGCGSCGGTTCGTVPMSWVKPSSAGPLMVDESVPDGATSADYCCVNIMDTLEAVCGEAGVEAPCLMPQVIETKEDTCGVDGIVGTIHTGGVMCCPLGCDICGSTGCGDQHISYVFPGDLPWSTTAPDGTTTADYCCTGAFAADLESGDRFCGDEGVEPPCLIPEATLAPRETVVDSCGVEGIEGIADGDRCCPLGCGQCGGSGCGSIDMDYITPTLGYTPSSDANSGMYCCTNAFDETTPTCGDDGVLPPCYIDLGTPAPLVGASPSPVLPPSDMLDNCNLPGMPGIMDSLGSRCCPQGCGMCGGAGCGSVDMSIVAPTVYGGVPDGATASDYCCVKGVDLRNVICGQDAGQGYPPCLIAAADIEDSCNVEGIEGVASSTREHCCPLGCGLCGGTGCGAVPESQIFSDGRVLPEGATAASYCCASAFIADTTPFCDEDGAEPPCFIPDGTPTPAPTMSTATLAPGTTPAPTTASNATLAPSTTPSPTMMITTASLPPSTTPSPTRIGMMGCEMIYVTVDNAEEFDGMYVKDPESDTTFVKNDTSAIMAYAPYDHDVNSTMGSLSSAMNDTSGCGYWVMMLVMDDEFTLADYPRVGVQDCATSPEDIDLTAQWQVLRSAELSENATGVVECTSDLPTPAPGATLAPGTTQAPAGLNSENVAPVSPGAGSSSSSSSGLSTGEAVGVGVAASVVAVVGAVSIARWAKGRS